MPVATGPRSPAPGPCRIGVLGGTFDPIHIGHLIIAQEAWFKLHLDKVVFVPAAIPPHKPDEPITDREHRYTMTALVIEDNPAFEVSRIEFERTGPSYTVDTMAEFRRLYGQDTELFFLMGADSLLEIPTWHKPEQLVELCTVVAAARPGYDLARAEKVLPSEFLKRIILLEVPDVDISSTELRSRVASGIPIMYLVPKSVESYIYQNRLYKAEE